MKANSTQKGMNVYRNGKWLEFVPTRDFRKLKRRARELIISTHMGEWQRQLGYEPGTRAPYHYTYSTTIGVYLLFSPATMSKESDK